MDELLEIFLKLSTKTVQVQLIIETTLEHSLSDLVFKQPRLRNNFIFGMLYQASLNFKGCRLLCFIKGGSRKTPTLGVDGKIIFPEDGEFFWKRFRWVVGKW